MAWYRIQKNFEWKVSEWLGAGLENQYARKGQRVRIPCLPQQIWTMTLTNVESLPLTVEPKFAVNNCPTGPDWEYIRSRSKGNQKGLYIDSLNDESMSYGTKWSVLLIEGSRPFKAKTPERNRHGLQ